MSDLKLALNMLKEHASIVDYHLLYTSYEIEVFLILHESIVESDNDNELEIKWLRSKLSLTERQQKAVDLLVIGIDEGWLSVELIPNSSKKKMPIIQSDEACWNWLAGFHNLLSTKKSPTSSTRFVHLYGYKGGQGRSAVLSQLAKELAFSFNHRVLVLDLDLEAPSQHLIFERTTIPSKSNFYEFCPPQYESEFGKAILPLEVISTGKKRSGVFLIGSQTDPDFLSPKLKFLQAVNTNPPLYKIILERIRSYIEKNGFDTVLLDHSTGLNPLVLPATQVFQGDGILFCKMDTQWREASDCLRILSRQLQSVAVVSFDQHGQSKKQRDERADYDSQLEDLEKIIFGDTEIEREKFSEFQIENFHHFWEYHEGYKSSLLPVLNEKKNRCQQALSEICHYFNFKELNDEAKASHAAGNKDKTQLVITEAINELFSRPNENLFLIGRKGVGKTKIANYFSESGTGFALILDAGEKNSNGLSVDWPSLRSEILKFKENPDAFWWKTFLTGISSSNDSSESLQLTFEKIGKESKPDGFFKLFENHARKPFDNRKIFLLDSLELLFDVDVRQKFINSLFMVLRVLDRFHSVGYRVFLRPDLASLAENSEQLMDGRKIDLRWYEEEALAFLLIKLVNLKDTRNFRSVSRNLADLTKSKNIIKLQSSLEELLENTIRVRGNPGVTQFFSSYFSDEALDLESRPTFNPRMIHFFVEELRSSVSSKSIKGDLIPSEMISESYREAAKQYLAGVIEELDGMRKNRNKGRIQTMLSAMRGEPTPYREKDLKEKLVLACGKEYEKDIFELFENMQRLGMMVNAGKGFGSHKRVSRLLREAIGMKINGRLNSSLR